MQVQSTFKSEAKFHESFQLQDAHACCVCLAFKSEDLAVLDGSAATARGFEPLRAEPNGFLVHHLNHSVTLSLEMKSNRSYCGGCCNALQLPMVI